MVEVDDRKSALTSSGRPTRRAILARGGVAGSLGTLPAGSDCLSFGLFHLFASERLLTKDGTPVELGSRALDVLLALVSTPNEVVSKKQLISLVWPDTNVEEGNLRFHVAGLRKALGDGQDGARYISTIPGRGYCFVAPTTRVRGNGTPNVTADFRYATAGPIFLTTSLLSECLHWVERGLLTLDDSQRGSAEEMRIQAAMGAVLAFLREERDARRAALGWDVESAEECDDRVNLIGYLSVLLKVPLQEGGLQNRGSVRNACPGDCGNRRRIDGRRVGLFDARQNPARRR